MRFGVAFILCAVLAAGSFAAGLAASTDQAGFSIAVPAGWTEQPALEKTAVDGFRKNNPDDPLQAFVWANPKNTVFVLVQATTSGAQLDQGTFRSKLTAFHQSIPKSMGLTRTKMSISDDGYVMTANVEGDLGTLHELIRNEALVDSGRHVHAYSVTCMMVSPVSSGARADCGALLSSFNITLDRSTFAPLEPKSE